MNIKFESIFHVRPKSLPLQPSGHIVCGNACRLDWNVVCPHTAEEEVYVMGNPPYLGKSLQEESHKNDMSLIFNDISEGWKSLDYISSWFYKGACYCKKAKASFAFVTTNSISQGQQVSILWPLLLKEGLSISFAYKSFKWKNNAKNNAGVTVSIIGMSNNPLKKRIYGEDNIKLVSNINPYLIEFSNEIIYPLSKPVSCFPVMDYGVKAVDGGNLILSTYEKDLFLNNYPNREHYIRKFIGSDEYINDKDRFCLWIDDEELPEALEIKEIASRIEKVRQMRLNSRDEGARKLAQRAHQFREHPDLNECIIIPSVSSERREYIPIGFLEAGVVVSNLAFAIYEAPLWLFGILTSKMHMAWVKTVGGRLKTDYRYSAQLCYNTFPFPAINETQKQELEKLAQEVLDVRDQHFDMTLGEMYNPESMPEDLKEVHHRLDLAVDRCYRPEPFSSDEERLECLFMLYAKMTKK